MPFSLTTEEKMPTARQTTTQPSYDFLTGAPSSPPQSRNESRNTLRQSSGNKPGLVKTGLHLDMFNLRVRMADLSCGITGTDQLRAEIKALQYELSTLKSDREVTNLRHQSELEDAQRRAEEDASKALVRQKEASDD